MRIAFILVMMSALSSMAITCYAIYRKENGGPVSFTFMSLCTSIYLIAYIFEITSADVTAAYRATCVTYLGAPYIVPCMLLYTLEQHHRKASIALRVVIFAIPVAASFLVWTAPYHSLFYGNMTYYPGPPFAQLRFEKMPGYYVYIGHMFLMLIACVGIMLAAIWKKRYKKEDVLDIAAMGVLLCGAMFYFLGKSPEGIDLMPMVINISNAILLYSVIRLNRLHLLPFAWRKILDQAQDAIIIVDAEGGYLDANQGAKALFPGLASIEFGGGMDDLKDAEGKRITKANVGRDFTIRHMGQERKYQATYSEMTHKGKLACTSVTLHDVTEAQNLIRELNQVATYDSLTGIYNRRMLVKLLQAKFDEAVEKGTRLTLLLLDIDHFKDVNDTYGHLAGDETLREIAAILSKRLRKHDVVGRYGGEEFVIGLNGVQKEQAVRLANELRVLVEKHRVAYEGVTFSVTVSIGVASFGVDRHKTLENLIEDADNALYQAKASGRNRVEYFQEAD